MAVPSAHVGRSQATPATGAAGRSNISDRSWTGRAGLVLGRDRAGESIARPGGDGLEPAAGRDRVLVDGGCGMCGWFQRVVGRWDWLGRLQWLDGSDQRVLDQLRLGITVEQAMEAMILVRADGHLEVGFDAIRRICRQVPAFWLAWPIMSLPGVRHLGHRVYRKVASQRTRTCHLPSSGP